MRLLSGFKHVVSEIANAWSVGVIPVWGPFQFQGLRSTFQVISSKYWGSAPAYENTVVNYDLARQLYRNDGQDSNLGAHFARSIVDKAVEYMGVPSASVEAEVIDNRLNDCLHIYWADEINQMFRNTIRDSKCVVRIRQPSLDDPLMTAEEREHCTLEIIAPERVLTFKRNKVNSNIIDEAIIKHDVILPDEDAEFDFTTGALPSERSHEILEILTPTEIRWFDKTDMVELTEFGTTNDWGFIPLIEVWNEWDSTLVGGQSDLESSYPFIKAFHDALGQTLLAHKYHSIPKVKFKINEVATFIKNNFPEAFDSVTGQIKAQSTVSWTGKEMIFLQADEEGEFLEAKSVLGDSKILLEFLFDCICVSSETPKWAFMVVDQGASDSATNAREVPFEKRIDRKRINFQKPIQELLKMYMVIVGIQPQRATISWGTQQAQTLVTETQAFQQLVMALEVAAQRGIISDATYQATIRQFLPFMKGPEQESQDAKGNVQPLQVQDAQNVPAEQNGRGSKGNIPVTAGQQGRNE